MRHRRNEFNDGRKQYGDKRRGNTYKPWDQHMYREHLPRDRYSSSNINEDRQSSEARYSGSLSGFDCGLGKLTEYKEYLNNKYCDTSVNVCNKLDIAGNMQNPNIDMNRDMNNLDTRDKFKKTMPVQRSDIPNDVNKLQFNQSVHSNYQNPDVIEKNNLQSEYVNNYDPRCFGRNDELPNQSRFNYGVSKSKEQKDSYEFKERQSDALSNYGPFEKGNVNWKRKESDKYLDLQRQNSDYFRKDRTNTDHVHQNYPLQKFHHTDFFANNSRVHSHDKFDKFHQDRVQVPDTTQPRTNQTFGIKSSTFNLNPAVRDENYQRLPLVPEAPYFVSSVANFSQHGKEVWKEVQPPVSRNGFEISQSINRSEKCLGSIQNTPVPESLPIYRRPKDSFRGYHSLNAADSEDSIHQSTDSIHHLFVRSGTSLPIHLNIDTNILAPQIHTNIIQDVSMIPLPPPPPPTPPPPPCYPQQHLEDGSNSTTSTFAKDKLTNKSQTKCPVATSVNVVSSTSTDEVSSAVDKQNKTEELRTTSALPIENKEMKENLSHQEMFKAKYFQETCNEDFKGLNSPVNEESNESMNNDTVFKKRCDQSRECKSRFDSDQIDELTIDKRNPIPASEMKGNSNGDQVEIHDRNRVVNIEDKKLENSCGNNIQHQNKEDANDKQYNKRTIYKHGLRRHQNGRFFSNFNEPWKTNAKFHRPWQVDHRMNGQYRFKQHNTNRPIIRQSCKRTRNENQRLSGVGIHTYIRHRDNQSNRHPISSDYFRPWEKQGQIQCGITDDKNGNRDQINTSKSIRSSFFSTDLFPIGGNEEFWTSPTEIYGSDKNSRFWTNKDLNTVKYKRLDHDKDKNISSEKKEEKSEGKKCITKMDDEEKIKEVSVSTINAAAKSQEGNNTDSQETKNLSSDDLYKKKRQERYNHGHLFTEIIAVKNRHDKDKKFRDEKNGIESNSCKDINAVSTKTSQNFSKSIFGTSKGLKNLSPPSTVAMPILSILESAISKVTSKGLSKVAKPDISLENKLLKSGLSYKTKLGTYKIPYLTDSKEDTKNDKKVRFNMSLEVNVDECRSSTKQKDTSSKFMTDSKIKNNKKCLKAEKRSPDNLKKHRLKSGKEAKTTVYMKKLHPKLRHKIAKSCEVSKEIEDSIAVTGGNIEQMSTEGEEMYTKNNKSQAQDKVEEHQLEITRNKSSHMTRGKFVLFTPNTFKVKETLKTNQKEKTSENSTYRSDTYAKENLDKAVFSAKKHLLNRALAMEALTRDKTKPLVEAKQCQRKSLITSDTGREKQKHLAETYLTDFGENVSDRIDKSIGKDDNNNEKNMLENPEEASKYSPLKLDPPSTEYKPQRTVIGNYATQCLFGPIVSSTYYKRPGKARVTRNSKETFTGYLGCHAGSSQNDKVDLNQNIHNNICDNSKDESCNVQQNFTNSTSVAETSPLIDVVSVKSNASPCGFGNFSGKDFDMNNDEVKDNIDVVSVSCSASPCELGNFSGKDIDTNNEELKDNIALGEFENVAHIGIIDYPKNSCANIADVSDLDFEKGKKQLSESVNDYQRQNSYAQHSSNIYSPPIQSVWLNKYLCAKQELVDTLKSCQNVSSPPTSTLMTTSKNSEMLPVCSSTPVHNSDAIGMSPILTIDFEHKSPGNSVANTSSTSELQYETSHEEIEMYRNYQLSRGVSYSDSDVLRSPNIGTNDFTERKTGVINQNSIDVETLENENCSVQNTMCVSEKNAAESSSEIPFTGNGFENSAGNFESQFIEDSISDEKSAFQNSEGNIDLQQKRCENINIVEDFLDTSKNIFEDLVTDILTDVELMSSIPITTPDLANENTNASIEFQNSSTDSYQYQFYSPENGTLSQMPSCEEEHHYGHCNQTDAKTDSGTVFKSARAPTPLRQSRKPRFEKRFPKPLPRAKPQKAINAERSLYEAAERFLGDFDHKNKRSCCKVNPEVMNNTESEKMESVKVNKNEEQGKKTIGNDKIPNNMCSDKTNEQIKQLDKPCDVSDNVTKKMSIKLKNMDSEVPVVTRQQVAMKKLILRSKGQMKKSKQNVHKYYKSASKKRQNLLKGVYKSREKNLGDNRIPSIRLKASKKLNGKGKIAVEKWKKITPTSSAKEHTKEKQHKFHSKPDSDEKFKDAFIKDENKLLKLNKHNKGKHIAEHLHKESPSPVHENKIKNKSVKHSTSFNTFKKGESKKSNEKYVRDYPGVSEKGKGKTNTESKKNKSSTVASSPNNQSMRTAKADMDRKVKDIMYKQTCRLCSFSCYSVMDMKLHYSRKHENWCHRCKIQFNDKESCRYHISQNHNAEAWCDVCGSLFCHKASFERHLRSQVHHENLKFVNYIKNGSKRKETVSISDDDDDNSVEIVAVSKNVYDTKRLDSIGPGKHKKLKTTDDKSPTVNLNLKKQTSSEYVEISEDDVETKKVRQVKYCAVCKQYYRKMSAHLKTKKHDDMLKEKLNTVNPEDDSCSVYYSDMEDMSIHIDDDTQDEDDMEMTDNMSHSSDKSVVIVSDHDGNFEYESDECRAIPSEEDVTMYMKPGLPVKHADYSSHAQIKQETDRDQGSQIQRRMGDSTSRLKGVDGKREGRSTNVPIVVSTCRKEKCSPTLLVRNIAADLMCKDEPIDERQNIFESVKQKYCNISGSKSKNESNDECCKRNELVKNISNDKDTYKVEESNEDRIDNDAGMSDEVDLYRDMKDEDADDFEILSSTDYEVTENPLFHDDMSMDQD